MKRVSRIVSILLLLCLVSIWALPIKKAHAKAKKSISTKPKDQTQLHEQEKELEDLAKLQKEKADNVVFQTTKDIKVVQEDGKKQRVINTAKNVVNADNGDVLSSVRKTVKAENKGHGIPKVSAITKVDIPSEGIHNTFTEDGDEDISEEEAMAEKKNIPSIVSSEESDESSLDEDIKDLQKSSKVMATYLLETGNFERFEDALRDIVKVGLMTVSEANEYEKIVLKEYEGMMALEKAEELQAKVAQAAQAAQVAQAAQAAQAARVPLDYAERDYDIPYQMNNDMDTDEDEDDVMNVKRYIARRRGLLPLPTRRAYSGPDLADYADPLQTYNGYEDLQSDEAQDDGNEWLDGLLEQANGPDYPQERQYYNEQSREDPSMDQDRMQRIAHKIFDSEPLSKSYSPHPTYEDLESDEEEDEMMEPVSEEEEENDHVQSEEPVSALKALAKMETPKAKKPKAGTETKHQAKKQDVAATDKKKKKST